MEKLNDENRSEIIIQYANMLMTDFAVQMSKYDLYNYSRNFGQKKKRL